MREHIRMYMGGLFYSILGLFYLPSEPYSSVSMSLLIYTRSLLQRKRDRRRRRRYHTGLVGALSLHGADMADMCAPLRFAPFLPLARFRLHIALFLRLNLRTLCLCSWGLGERLFPRGKIRPVLEHLFFDNGSPSTVQPWEWTLRVTCSFLESLFFGCEPGHPLALFRGPFLPLGGLNSCHGGVCSQHLGPAGAAILYVLFPHRLGVQGAHFREQGLGTGAKGVVHGRENGTLPSHHAGCREQGAGSGVWGRRVLGGAHKRHLTAILSLPVLAQSRASSAGLWFSPRARAR